MKAMKKLAFFKFECKIIEKNEISPVESRIKSMRYSDYNIFFIEISAIEQE